MRIGVITTSRADYGIYRPLLSALFEHPKFELVLYVGGMHLLPDHNTIHEIMKDPWEIAATFPGMSEGVSQEEIASSIGRISASMVTAFRRKPSDLIICLGDRFEMFAAVSTLLPFGVQICHIHGGELTLGAIDERYRHALTKLSDIHFVSTHCHSRRVQQMGEEASRVCVTGALSLDGIERKNCTLHDFNEAAETQLEDWPWLVTLHPETNLHCSPEEQVDPLLRLMENTNDHFLITQSNADLGGVIINKLLIEASIKFHHIHFVPNLGKTLYFSVLANCKGVIGNSSSGIIEAASFGRPVLNIGRRQEGRLYAENVLTVKNNKNAVRNGFSAIQKPGFQKISRSVKNPYGLGDAASRMICFLEEFTNQPRSTVKCFTDLEYES